MPIKITQKPDILVFSTGESILSIGVILTENADIIQENKLLREQVEHLLTVKEELAEVQSRFQALSQATFEAVFISEKGICIEANQAAATIFGYSHAELIGIFGTDVIAPECHKLVRNNILSGSEEPYEAVGLRKDGSRFPCEIQGRMFEYKGNQVRATVLRDISYQVEIQQRLQQSQKLEALGTLAGGIAHDFNNLLTIILGQVDLLNFHPLTPEFQSSVDAIGRAGNRASALIKQLLTFSKQEPLQLDPINLNTVIKDMRDMLQRLISEDITLKFDLCHTDLVILSDASQLEQIVFNLVTNARDAIHSNSEKHAAKTILIKTQANHQGNVILEVTDTGTGIDKEQQTKIFDPFFTTKTPSRGTGLGLATVYGIVKNNGGSISLTSGKKSGTTFNVSWPGTDHQPWVFSETASAELKHSSGNILVVEDDPDVLEVTATGLRGSGFSVDIARTAQLAMELVGRKNKIYDVLITDEIMPGISGLELISWMRVRSSETSFILMSGHTFDRIPATSSLPADVGFQPKPFSTHELVELITKQRLSPS